MRQDRELRTNLLAKSSDEPLHMSTLLTRRSVNFIHGYLLVYIYIYIYIYNRIAVSALRGISACKSAFFGLAAQCRPRLGSGDFGSFWEAILLHRFAFLAPLFQEPPSARIWRFSYQFPCSFWLLFFVPCTLLSTDVSSLAQTLSSGLAWLFRVAFDTKFRGHFRCYALEFLLRF